MKKHSGRERLSTRLIRTALWTATVWAIAGMSRKSVSGSMTLMLYACFVLCRE